jgi:pyrroline-5-carboxylate reductase
VTIYALGVIGGGNMAEAILRGVLAARVLGGEDVVVSEPRVDRRDLLARDLHVTCVDDNAAAAACPCVLLAVKPQVMNDVLDGIAPAVWPAGMVISIAAGVATARIDQRLGGRGRIVRAMPNTPMLVGAGMTAVAPGPRAGKEDLEWAEKLFAACGRVVRVTEPMIDAVTAVSGSGPAYFFYLIEAMIAAGAAEGLDPAVAAQLAIQTCAGAAKLLAETGEKPEVLRARVTSPNGTTQRAIETLDAAGVKAHLVAAVRAAAARSRELGK